MATIDTTIRRPRHPRDAFGAVVARSAGALARVTHLGAGTSLPGRVAERLSPGYLTRQASDLADGVVVVSGTNGKTTTAAIVCTILETAGYVVVANRSGANMAGGVAGAFLKAPRGATIAVLEADEAALPQVVRLVAPRVLVLTNVFRDQLDRFGEPERVAGLLREAARSIPSDAAVIANADDLLLWDALSGLSPIGFGVTGIGASATLGRDAEPIACPRCGAAVVYARRTIGHLGAAACHQCGWASAEPTFPARVVARAGMRGEVFDWGGSAVTLAIGGLHNVYNAAAALTVAHVLGISEVQAVRALETFRARFGRGEEIELDGRRLWICLMKNPAGAGAVVETVTSDSDVTAVIVAVNDLDADGRDVSWIWDVEFEPLVGLDVPLIAAGRRAEEVALRLKYAGATEIGTAQKPLDAIAAATTSSGGGTVVVLATYTAMLGFRQALKGRVARVADAA